MATGPSLKAWGWWGVRWGIGGVFLVAGVLKLWDPPQLAADIARYRLLPKAGVWGLSYYLPWLEIVGGVGVLTRWYYRGALSLLAGLLAVFLGALGSAWARGLVLTCGCFGAGGPASYPWLVGRDLALLGGLGLLTWHHHRGAAPTLRPAPLPPPSGPVRG